MSSFDKDERFVIFRNSVTEKMIKDNPSSVYESQVEYSLCIVENELKYLVHANIVEVLHSNVVYDTYTLTTLGKEKVKVFQDAQILYYELCKIAVEQNGLALEFV